MSAVFEYYVRCSRVEECSPLLANNWLYRSELNGITVQTDVQLKVVSDCPLKVGKKYKVTVEEVTEE